MSSSIFLPIEQQRHLSRTAHHHERFWRNLILMHQRCSPFMERTSPRPSPLVSSLGQIHHPMSRFAVRRYWVAFPQRTKFLNAGPLSSFVVMEWCSLPMSCILSGFGPVIFVYLSRLFHCLCFLWNCRFALCLCIYVLSISVSRGLFHGTLLWLRGWSLTD